MVDITATIESPEEISVTVEGGITNFISLTDVDPTTYSGQSGKVVSVNSGEDGLEFSSAGAGDVTGPGSATDENITIFDSTTGKLIKDSGTNISAVSSNTSASHAESHDIASHSDTTATGTELNTLTGGGDTTLHDHDGISENTTHRGSDGSDHSIVGSNTTAIGLNTTHRGSAGGTDHSDVSTNNSKVSNANHSGDATGSTALTLATVNSNVGSFTNADITVNAKGLITAAANGSSGFTWNEVTGTTQSASVDNGYITNNASLVTVTLPDTAPLGSTLRIAGLGNGGWKLAQNASELIYFGNSTTTTGTGGSLASTLSKDSIELVCVVANTEWSVISSVGNITVV